MRAITAKNIDEYIQQYPTDVQLALQDLRQLIKATAPKAEEVISYQIPGFKYFGSLVFFAAFDNHCSFFVIRKDILTLFKKELQGYKCAGTTIHFSPDKPLPATIVKKIVKLRIKENEELAALKGMMKASGGKAKKLKS